VIWPASSRQPSLSPKSPRDAVTHHDRRDRLTPARLDHRPPRDECKSQPVFQHGETATRECHRAPVLPETRSPSMAGRYSGPVRLAIGPAAASSSRARSRVERFRGMTVRCSSLRANPCLIPPVAPAPSASASNPWRSKLLRYPSDQEAVAA
jgi:hypothetical protein